MAMVNCILFWSLKKISPNSFNSPHKISLWTLGLSLNMTMFVSIEELYYAFNIQSLYSYASFPLIVLGTSTFFCSLLFTYSFIPVISRMTAIQYLQFYLVSFGYIWLVIRYSTDSTFLVFNSLTLLPQIIYN